MDKTYAYILLPVEVIFKISKKKKENKDIYIYIYIFPKKALFFSLGTNIPIIFHIKTFLLGRL